MTRPGRAVSNDVVDGREAAVHLVRESTLIMATSLAVEAGSAHQGKSVDPPLSRPRSRLRVGPGGDRGGDRGSARCVR